MKPKLRKGAIVNVFFPSQPVGGTTRIVADNVSVLQKEYADDFELVAFTTDSHPQLAYETDIDTLLIAA